MITREEFVKHKMQGLHFQLVITADNESAFADALQSAIEDIGQGNKHHGGATDEWFYQFSVMGKATTEEV